MKYKCAHEAKHATVLGRLCARFFDFLKRKEKLGRRRQVWTTAVRVVDVVVEVKAFWVCKFK